jgi:hypothetical protein
MPFVKLLQPRTYHRGGKIYVQGVWTRVTPEVARVLEQKPQYFEVIWSEKPPTHRPPAPRIRAQSQEPEVPIPSQEPLDTGAAAAGEAETAEGVALDPAAPEPLDVEALRELIDGLSEDDETAWGPDGKPSLAKLAELAGVPVTAEERDRAMRPPAPPPVRVVRRVVRRRREG